MPVERYEVYSLEIGDTIIIQDTRYAIVGTDTGDMPDTTCLFLQDEDGEHSTVTLPDSTKVRVSCDIVYAE